MPEWGWILVALGVLGVVDQMAIAAERRGLISWRHRRSAEAPRRLRPERGAGGDGESVADMTDEVA